MLDWFQKVKIMFPKHKRPGGYPGAYWQDDKGRFIASVTAHELTNDGKSVHDHWTVKTVRKDRDSGLDRSRLHVTFGQEISQVQVTDYAQLVCYKPIFLKGDDNRWYQIKVEGGQLKAVQTDGSHVITTQD